MAISGLQLLLIISDRDKCLGQNFLIDPRNSISVIACFLWSCGVQLIVKFSLLECSAV
jgi:hypothetical protein